MCQSLPQEVESYLQLGLAPIPLKPGINWAVYSGGKLAVIDRDSEDAYRNSAASHRLPSGYPVVKTGRGYHMWVKPKKSISSPCVNSAENKCLGSYMVVPSIHPSGVPYVFEIASSGGFPEVELEILLGLPPDSAKYQVQRIYATTWLRSHSLLWCGKVELVQAGKDG